MIQPVLSELDGEVQCITLSRPDRRNAVDQATATALYQAFLDFEANAAAKVAVFHGAYGHFCAGWDLQAGAQSLAQHPEGVDAAMAQWQHTLDFETSQAERTGGVQGPMGPSRMRLSKPVIASLSGAAVAGGMELALWCDLRVMEEDAYFGIYCRRFGVPLIDGGTVRLPRLIGMGHAMDLILTGRKVEAEEALRMGLCNRIAPKGEGLAHAMQLARQLCAFPQRTMLADRASAYEQEGLPLAQALHQEWERGKHCIGEGLKGATRFSEGEGRGGRF
jgi:enoyl-CoA hydratase